MPIFPIAVDDEIQLELISTNNADALLSIILNEKSYLSEWLAWPAHTHNMDDFMGYVNSVTESYNNGTGMACCILYKGQPVGAVGFNTIDSVSRKVEIGYWLSQHQQGNGIMTRVCQAMIRIAFDDLGMDKIDIPVATNNKPSRGVCERLGMVIEGTIANAEDLNGRMVDHVCYALYRQFEITPNYMRLMKATLVGLVLFFVASVALPICLYDKDTSIIELLTLSMPAMMFGGFLWLTVRSLIKLPHSSVQLDESGIWSIRQGKEQGLIKWQRIASIKEKPVLQEVDLIDQNGNTLMSLSYALDNINALRAIVTERKQNNTCTQKTETFVKPRWHHALYWLSFLVYPLVAVYIVMIDEWLIAVLGLVTMGFIVHEYLTTVSGIRIESGGVQIIYPASKKWVLYDDIKHILLTGDAHKKPEIKLVTQQTTFELKRIGSDVNGLYAMLKSSLKNKQMSAKKEY